jgi:type II restriction/modification system DNA methylase subunit YeeA
MAPEDFISKWRAVELKERSASQSHFNDLCALLGLKDPITEDPKGDWFTFEKGASKSSGGEGWADVWRRDCFAWEYKGRRKDLNAAFTQLQNYAIALENPPLLIVSDMDRIRIHTNWTNTVQKVYDLTLEDLRDAAHRDTLRACFTDPERLKPQKTRQLLTEEAANRFAQIAQRLRARGHDPQAVAHFVNRLVFCMFAEDVNMLPPKMFERMIKAARPNPATFATHAATLFSAMRAGGLVGFEQVEWFNGGLFDSDDTLPLTWEDMDDLIRATAMDWSDIDPSILGTLFERGLDPDKRSQLGAHYTDRDKIMQIMRPVIVDPLLAEWAEVKVRITAELGRAETLTGKAATKARAEAQRLRTEFGEKLAAIRVLDPACGSGNFLYLALLELKNIEHLVNLEAEALGFNKEFPRIGPEAVLGIELNPYAAELARVSVWIGEIQWMRRNGFEAARNPILKTLDTIQNRDAVLGPDGGRAEWPKADVVVGNPPFLGTKRMRSELGDLNVDALYAAYRGTVRQEADLVCYWFARAWQQIANGDLTRAGLVSTNSIRGGANRDVLKPITEHGRIFAAWGDEAWTVDGAAVRVSLICFDGAKGCTALLDGNEVAEVYADLTAKRSDGGGVDLTKAVRLGENRGVAFMGDTKGGAFEIPGDLAREMLLKPLNPHGHPNSDVLRPWVNGMDITRRPSDKWIIDFGWTMTEGEAALYEEPFRHCLLYVKPERDNNRRDAYRNNWWRHVEARQGMWEALKDTKSFIVSPRVSKHRLFSWLSPLVVPDSATIAIARDDDTTFGILHSRFHELWALRMGTSLEDRPRYTPSTTFETFPFPEGLTPNISAADYAADPRAQAIAAAAARLNELRENWLNPSDLVQRVPEVVPGYPERILPRDARAEAELKKRTLTNLYNTRPAWLDHAHKALDQAVADAYGWGDDQRGGKLTDDEILARLFRLNQERSSS